MDAAAQQQMCTKRRHTTMKAAAEQERTNNRRQIPPEIVETILMHLPIKSLIRFSRVSKSWKSLIFEPNFTKKRAAVGDGRRLLMSPHRGFALDVLWGDPKFELTDASSRPLSSVCSDNAVEDARPIVFPIEGKSILRASCGGLLCVEVNKSLYLWNPSINSYKKLTAPSLPLVRHIEYVYGLGYDSFSDDYKIFKLQWNIGGDHECELYSLKSDSWRMIDHQPFSRRRYEKCVFVGGALHWSTWRTIISFDIETEKYGNIAPPPDQELTGSMEVSALRGKLCVHSCNSGRFWFRFVMSVMEEYGIEKSWTKIFDIENGDRFAFDPVDGRIFQELTRIKVTPLYLFDNGEVLLRVRTNGMKYALFMCKGEETRLRKVICNGICHGCVYDESLISPLKFVKLN